MVKTRQTLHNELVKFLGSSNVYFQPPESVKMQYPCIVYNRSSGDTLFADDLPYRFTQSYEVTIIDKNPDSGLPQRLATTFPMIRFNRHYTAENLNHDTFILYY